MVLKKLSQVRSEKSGDRFVRASSELSIAIFDFGSFHNQRKLNFVFRGEDLERQDGHGWKIEMTCEQCCVNCLVVAAIV